MKLTKLFGLLGMACVLTLASCNNSGSNTPGGDDEDESEDEGEDESEEPEYDLTFDEISLEKENNKVVIKVNFTDEGTGAKKWAWGLASNGSFIYGSDEPEFNINYTVGADKTGSISFDLTAAMATVTDFENGTYSVYGGNEGNYRDIRINDEANTVKDDTYTYYVRNDLNQLAIEKSMALEFKTAKVVAPTAYPNDYEHQGNHVQIIAPLPAGTTLETLNAFEVNGDFQRMGNYSKPGFEGYFWTIENNNAVLNVYIGFMAQGERWMTHLGIDAAPANLFLTDKIEGEEYTIGEWKYAVTADQAAGQAGGEAKYYGCLGIEVLAAPAADEGDGDSSDDNAVTLA